MTTPVYCETVELAHEASSVARALGLAVDAEHAPDPLVRAARAAAEGVLAAAICIELPAPEALIDALHTCSERGRVVLGAIAQRDRQGFGLAADLGFVCVRDVAPVLSAIAIVETGIDRPWRANARKLSSSDQVRLARALGQSERGAARLATDPDGAMITLARGEQTPPARIGGGLAVAEALAALAAAEPCADARRTLATPPDRAATRDVLYGPPRLLSDPASKAALLPFGLPMPQEELCSSPSRAASEAGRIGFPVRISLASPDLRVWDHPELSVDGVDNAARVRDVYRQLLAAAQELAPEARVLGVTVTATTLARALTRVSARPAPHGRVLLRVGFSDPHGATAKDAISTVLPAAPASVERALTRLEAELLVLGQTSAERAKNLTLLSELFARVAAFIDANRNEVARLELHPVALLVDGGAEIREAAVEVTDAFLRELD
ncbi:MAG: acetate--CoA ligase family protein [Polyangiales bacterium]